MACRPTLTASVRDGRGDPRSGRRKACGAVEQRKVTDENSACDRQLATGYCPAEEIELAGIVVRLGGDRLVVTTYLGVMVCLEFEGELHECVGNVSGDFIGNGELVGLFCAGFARHRSTVDLGLGAEALAFDDDGIDVVEDAIQDVIVEDLRPVLVGTVGGDQHRRALVALADDLEQQICTVLSMGRYPSSSMISSRGFR